ncbi:MAG: tetratricopeptide repeat protein [Acidobacteriota bacterium]
MFLSRFPTGAGAGALCLLLASPLWAQAPSSVQFFMPDGSMPTRELRLQVTTDDGKVTDTFFTDSKGRFLIARSQGLPPNAGYTIRVEGDERTFDTTIVSFKLYTLSYIPVFLRPWLPPVDAPAATVELAQFDAKVPNKARKAYQQAIEQLEAGKSDAALKKLRRAVAIHPAYFRALNDLGVLLMQLGRFSEAAEEFERAVSIGPTAFLARLNLGIVRTKQSRYDEGLKILEDLHRDFPLLLEARIRLADVLAALGRVDESETHLRAVLADARVEKKPAGDAHYKLGLALNRKQLYADAALEFSKAVKILPASANAQLQLGGALMRLERLEEAEFPLRESYRLGGAAMGGAQLLLGQIYITQGKIEDARLAFEQYLKDVPQALNAADVRAVIAKIK